MESPVEITKEAVSILEAYLNTQSVCEKNVTEVENCGSSFSKSNQSIVSESSTATEENVSADISTDLSRRCFIARGSNNPFDLFFGSGTLVKNHFYPKLFTSNKNFKCRRELALDSKKSYSFDSCVTDTHGEVNALKNHLEKRPCSFPPEDVASIASHNLFIGASTSIKPYTQMDQRHCPMTKYFGNEDDFAEKRDPLNRVKVWSPPKLNANRALFCLRGNDKSNLNEVHQGNRFKSKRAIPRRWSFSHLLWSNFNINATHFKYSLNKPNFVPANKSKYNLPPSSSSSLLKLLTSTKTGFSILNDTNFPTGVEVRPILNSFSDESTKFTQSSISSAQYNVLLNRQLKNKLNIQPVGLKSYITSGRVNARPSQLGLLTRCSSGKRRTRKHKRYENHKWEHQDTTPVCDNYFKSIDSVNYSAQKCHLRDHNSFDQIIVNKSIDNVRLCSVFSAKTWPLSSPDYISTDRIAQYYRHIIETDEKENFDRSDKVLTTAGEFEVQRPHKEAQSLIKSPTTPTDFQPPLYAECVAAMINALAERILNRMSENDLEREFREVELKAKNAKIGTTGRERYSSLCVSNTTCSPNAAASTNATPMSSTLSSYEKRRWRSCSLPNNLEKLDSSKRPLSEVAQVNLRSAFLRRAKRLEYRNKLPNTTVLVTKIVNGACYPVFESHMLMWLGRHPSWHDIVILYYLTRCSIRVLHKLHHKRLCDLHCIANCDGENNALMDNIDKLLSSTDKPYSLINPRNPAYGMIMEEIGKYHANVGRIKDFTITFFTRWYAEWVHEQGGWQTMIDESKDSPVQLPINS